MIHERITKLADFIERQPDYYQGNPSRCIAGQAKRLLIRENPLRLLNPAYWLPLATPRAITMFGIPRRIAHDIYVTGWRRRSGFTATRYMAARALRRLAATGEFSWL